MKSRRTQIICTLATIILVVGFVLVPHEAHALGVLGSTGVGAATGAAVGSFIPVVGTGVGAVIGGVIGAIHGLTNFDVVPYVNAILEILANFCLLLGNLFVQITGYLLNATMTLTLNMSSLVNASGGIVDSTWSIIRDLCSVLIIFFLLYVSIAIIIQRNDSKVRHLIIMVVVAGILINFSLFFTKIAVDTSNLVSLAFYRAITPVGATFNGTGSYLTTAVNDGGLSNTFMNALEIQRVYTPVQTATGTIDTSPLTVVAAGIGGTAIEVVAGLSFLGAAILFAIRIAMLIILMAFSPVFFLGMIIPEVKSKLSDKWKEHLLHQCFIMPVYMLFMYVALRVITNPTFKNILHPTGLASSGTIVSPDVMGTIIQQVIALILISIPLFAALQYASFGSKFVDSVTKKVKGTLGKQTAGRLAHVAGNSKFMQNYVSRNPRAGLMIQNKLGNIADSGFGDGKKGFATDQEKKQKAYKKAYEAQDETGKKRMLENMQKRPLGALANIPVLRSTPIIGTMLSKTAKFSGGAADEFATKKIGEIEKDARNDEATKNIDKKLEGFESAMEANNAVLGHIEAQMARGTTDSGKNLNPQNWLALLRERRV